MTNSVSFFELLRLWEIPFMLCVRNPNFFVSRLKRRILANIFLFLAWFFCLFHWIVLFAFLAENFNIIYCFCNNYLEQENDHLNWKSLDFSKTLRVYFSPFVLSFLMCVISYSGVCSSFWTISFSSFLLSFRFAFFSLFHNWWGCFWGCYQWWVHANCAHWLRLKTIGNSETTFVLEIPFFLRW